MRTYNDAYKTGGKSSNKHLGGSREHFDNGRDYEYEKWADEHNGNVAESKTMNKKLIRLTESDLHRIIKRSVNKILKESFEDDFNTARDKHVGKGGLFGMELKNSEGDWQYGDVTYDPNTNTMSCMGVSIQVDPDMSIDQNLEGLYDELINNGYTDGDDEDDEWPEERIEDRIDTEANMDDYPV
jgi:hypothetical protein